MPDNLNLTLIFPMAGRSAKFGYQFAPFLKVGDVTFIQRAVSSFDKYMSHIKEVVFIYLKEQEKNYNVNQRLKEIFPGLNFRTIILEQATNGPAETVRNAIKKDSNIKGPVIICDCDHYLDISQIFNYLLEDNTEQCVIPIWNLRNEDIKSWCISAMSDENFIIDIAEKELPKSAGRFFGVIGCYYFKDHSLIDDESSYISHTIKKLVSKGEKIKGVQIFNAEFFGDPERLKSAIDAREKRKGTIFCNIEGTLAKDENFYDRISLDVLPGTQNKLKQWNEEGYKLILTTSMALKNREKLVEALTNAGISYDDLIMDIPHGPKHLITDRKASAILTPHAISFEIETNKGISDLHIDSTKPNILKMFRGGSLSRTLLVEKSGKLFVRKVVSRDKSMFSKYVKLKKQFNDIKRLGELCRDLFPRVGNETENSFEYYYDIEFLSDYDLLYKFSSEERLRAVKILVKRLTNSLYKPGAHISNSGDEWLLNHFSQKIYPKLKEGELPNALYYFVNTDRVKIDGRIYSGLYHLLKKAIEHPYINKLKPSYLCPIHGDLTFENILYKNSRYNIITNSYEPEIKLIDTDCIDFIDPPELDLGKMFQSIVSQYESWSASNESLTKIENNEIFLNFKPNRELLNDLAEYVSFWSDAIRNSKKEIEIKGYFYMALHLIRMIPFRLSVSEDQALYALATSIQYMSKALEAIKEITSFSERIDLESLRDYPKKWL